MPRAVARCLGVLAVAATLLALTAPAAGAWSNGPGGDGFGMHDWILYQANTIAVARGYRWLDWPVAQKATDDPDTKLHDTRNHVYQLGARRYGASPDRVAELYAQVVRELRQRDKKAASYSMGLLAHYLADTGNPLHTDQITAEERAHTRYERAVERLAQEGAPPPWLRPTGLDRSVPPRQLTVQAAERAHRSYCALVAEFGAHGYDAKVDAITKASLAAAVGDLESMLVMAGKAAAPPAAATTKPGPAADASSPAAGETTSAAALPASATREATGAGEAVTAATEPKGQPGSSAPGVAAAVSCCAGLAFVGAVAGVLTLYRRRRRRA